MTASTKRQQMQNKPWFDMSDILTVLVVALGAVASACGLFIAGLYRDPVGIIPVLQGQDLVTLVAMPVLLVAWLSAKRGSVRSRLVCTGILGYMLYTYTGAAMSYYFNQLFLLYVALFSLSIFALTVSIAKLDMAKLAVQFTAKAPRGPVALFLLLVALMLVPVELSQVISFLTTGTLPDIIVNTGSPTCFVYVLDLGLIVPLSVLSAVSLWRRLPWGYVLASVMLVKGASMGLALLSMNWFALRVGGSTDGLVPIWAIITVGSLGMVAWLLRNCQATQDKQVNQVA